MPWGPGLDDTSRFRNTFLPLGAGATGQGPEAARALRDGNPREPWGAMGAMGQGPKAHEDLQLGLGNLEVNLLPSIDPWPLRASPHCIRGLSLG